MGLAVVRRVAVVAERQLEHSVSSEEAPGLGAADHIAAEALPASCLDSDDRKDQFAAVDSGHVDASGEVAYRGAGRAVHPDEDDIFADVDAWASDGPEYAAEEAAVRASDGHASADVRTSAFADDAVDVARDRLSLQGRQGLQDQNDACDADQAVCFVGEDPSWGRDGSLDRASFHSAVPRHCYHCSAATLCLFHHAARSPKAD